MSGRPLLDRKQTSALDPKQTWTGKIARSPRRFHIAQRERLEVMLAEAPNNRRASHVMEHCSSILSKLIDIVKRIPPWPSTAR